MNLTKKLLVDLIQQINTDVCKMKLDLKSKDQQIAKLTEQNQDLRESNLATLDQIRKYIKELEQIKSHYVNSNNNS